MADLQGFQVSVVYALRTIQTDCNDVLSLSTLHREYAALIAAEYYDFADRILRPYLSLPSNVDSKEIKQVMEKYNVNEPQARAIATALKTDGFVLIQGYVHGYLLTLLL